MNSLELVSVCNWLACFYMQPYVVVPSLAYNNFHTESSEQTSKQAGAAVNAEKKNTTANACARGRFSTYNM